MSGFQAGCFRHPFCGSPEETGWRYMFGAAVQLHGAALRDRGQRFVGTKETLAPEESCTWRSVSRTWCLPSLWDLEKC